MFPAHAGVILGKTEERRMNHFKMIKLILKAFSDGLEKSKVELTAESLGISDVYFANLCDMLEEQGFVRHIKLLGINRDDDKIADVRGARITLAGLEYLYSNKHMQDV
jgi:hypothetical protein